MKNIKLYSLLLLIASAAIYFIIDKYSRVNDISTSLLLYYVVIPAVILQAIFFVLIMFNKAAVKFYYGQLFLFIFLFIWLIRYVLI